MNGFRVPFPRAGDSPNVAGIYRSSRFDPPPHGATRDPLGPHRHRCVSIRAPARGRPSAMPTASSGSCFDPRPRTGGDIQHGMSFSRGPGFDPRPARGATRYTVGAHLVRDSFDPRPRTGGDAARDCSTSRRACFDPRPRTGGDRRRLGRGCSLLVSIRAPARGATLVVNREPPLSLVFRSAPPHGGRQCRIRRQFRHRRFRSAPPHGGRLRDAVGRVRDRHVSIRAPHGGRQRAVYSTRVVA